MVSDLHVLCVCFWVLCLFLCVVFVSLCFVCFCVLYLFLCVFAFLIIALRGPANVNVFPLFVLRARSTTLHAFIYSFIHSSDLQ